MNQKAREKEKGLEQYFFRASAEDFKKIPGCPIAYWFSDNAFSAFSRGKRLEETMKARRGLSTGDNEQFVRFWHEVSHELSSFGVEVRIARWFPYNKGGDYRKWYGNNDLVVNWEDDGKNIKNQPPKPSGDRGWRTTSEEFYLRTGITWTGLTSGDVSFRSSKEGGLFDTNKGPMAFPEQDVSGTLLGFLNSRPSAYFLAALNPTISTQNEDIDNLPFSAEWIQNGDSYISRLISVSAQDWDSYETSWDFTMLTLLSYQPSVSSRQQKINDHCILNADNLLSEAYANIRTHWQETTLETQRLEEENNRIFIEAYCLQDELTPEVPLKEITLTCNPHYRYGGNKTDEELEVLLLADTMKEFISYAVGCMFGRYALEKPGLILANQGETIDDYLKKIPEPSFFADDDNVIPMLDGDWFTDDITERFFKFLRVTFGDEHYEDNLKFIEQAIGKDVRKYFLKDFYSDHVKRYKKRPIYWMFSSPKGSFNALIYMHRYRPDTVSVVLNDYLREFRSKLTARKNHLEAVSISASASQSEKTKALKETDKLNKMISEMEEYEREVLYPLATEQVEIDLDDGVKVNYNKFGEALKKIVGLSGKG